LKVGLLVTYVAPLVFVLIVTMIKEGYDDIQRYRRDQVLNKTKYDKVDPKMPYGIKVINAQDIKVG
jgi:phospholipid-translocating ATPase